MTRGLFVTGTDTGVGKTVIAAALLRLARRAGIEAAPFKPVQTGCDEVDGRLVSPDLELCLLAGEMDPPARLRASMCPFRYSPACSPHLAGRLAGRYPSLAGIKESAEALGADYQAVIGEGAGGLLVPIDEQRTMLDLMCELAWPVVLVGRGALGTINHTLLSAGAVRQAGLELIGVVLCDAEPVEADFIRRDNPPVIEKFGRVEILGDVPFIPDLSSPRPRPDAWDDLAKHLTGIDRILDALR